MAWLVVLGIFSIWILIEFLQAPIVIRSAVSANLSEAINNARQLGMMLFEFEAEYGKFPDSATIPEVRMKHHSNILTLSDRTSNDLFTQLFAAEIATSEAFFYASAKSAKRPDNIFGSNVTALAHGETSFAYISGLSAYSDPPHTPLVFGPVIPGTTTLDTKSCEGFAIILWLDNSVTTFKYDSTGKIMDHGLDLLDPRQPYWHGKAPDVKWPK